MSLTIIMNHSILLIVVSFLLTFVNADDGLESTASKVAGHQGRIRSGTKPNTLLKMATGNEEICFNELKNDKLAYFVPKIHKIVELDGARFLEQQDLLAGFSMPSVLDAKIGLRTFKEDEVSKLATPRLDLYNKMVQVDPNEPNLEENKAKAITKARYLMWRDSASSSASLGFRIEGIHYGDGRVEKDFKRSKDMKFISEALKRFVPNDKIRLQYLRRLRTIRRNLLKSKFFKSHELVGSSLLFVHDQDLANIWMIDFAETKPLPPGVRISHRNPWKLGNHEDGYLIGLENLISIFSKFE